MKFRDGVGRGPGGRWHLRIMVDGKIIRRTFGTRGEAEAVRGRLRARAVAASLGLPVPEGPKKAATLGLVLEAHIQECRAVGASAKHLYELERSRNLILKACGGASRPADFTRADLVGLVGWMRENTRSQGRAAQLAVSILRTALKRAELPVPPAPVLRLPARRRKTMTLEELRRLLVELPLGTAARTAVEVGLATGARESEIRRIRTADVDHGAGVIWLRRQKGKAASVEACPMTARLRGALEAFEAGPVFLFSDGSAEPGQSRFRRALVAACRRAGVPVRTTVGWTRAEVATLSRDHGAQIRAVADALGHSDERVTVDHYDESRRAEVERFESRRVIGEGLARILDDENLTTN